MAAKPEAASTQRSVPWPIISRVVRGSRPGRIAALLGSPRLLDRLSRRLPWPVRLVVRRRPGVGHLSNHPPLSPCSTTMYYCSTGPVALGVDAARALHLCRAQMACPAVLRTSSCHGPQAPRPVNYHRIGPCRYEVTAASTDSRAHHCAGSLSPPSLPVSVSVSVACRTCSHCRFAASPHLETTIHRIQEPHAHRQAIAALRRSHLDASR